MNKIITPTIAIFLLLINCAVFGISSNADSKTIYLIGENHYESNTDADFQRMIFQQAVEKKLVYAMEGLEHDVLAEKEFIEDLKMKGFPALSSGYLYGVEDPFFIIFKDALSLNNLFRANCRRYPITDSLSEKVIKTKKNDLLCPLVIKTNQRFLKNFWNSTLQGNPIFNYLKTNKESLIKKTFTVQTQIFASQIRKWSNEDWIDFTQEIVLILTEDLKTKLPLEKLQTLEYLLTCLDEFELDSDCDGSVEDGTFLRSLNLTLRDDFLANNLEKIYNSSKKTQKPLVSILGHAHIPGITEALVNKGFTVLGKQELLKRLNELNKREL